MSSSPAAARSLLRCFGSLILPRQACFAAAPDKRSCGAAQTASFVVASSPLVAVLSGVNTVAGGVNPATVDCSQSFDPDDDGTGNPGNSDFYFDWQCDGPRGPGACLTIDLQDLEFEPGAAVQARERRPACPRTWTDIRATTLCGASLRSRFESPDIASRLSHRAPIRCRCSRIRRRSRSCSTSAPTAQPTPSPAQLQSPAARAREPREPSPSARGAPRPSRWTRASPRTRSTRPRGLCSPRAWRQPRRRRFVRLRGRRFPARGST